MSANELYLLVALVLLSFLYRRKVNQHRDLLHKYTVVLLAAKDAERALEKLAGYDPADTKAISVYSDAEIMAHLAGLGVDKKSSLG